MALYQGFPTCLACTKEAKNCTICTITFFRSEKGVHRSVTPLVQWCRLLLTLVQWCRLLLTLVHLLLFTGGYDFLYSLPSFQSSP